MKKVSITKHYALMVSNHVKEIFSIMANGDIILKGKKIGKSKEVADLILQAYPN